MRYFSMFSGIGGFELGISRAFDVSEKRGGQTTAKGINEKGSGLYALPEQRASRTQDTDDEHANRSINKGQPNCVGYSEIDKYAIKVYERQFNGHRNYGDATAINPTDLPDFDLLVGGFPCQAFSIAGKRKGFDDTRGTLFFDIARILAEKRPRHLVLENVKGLLSHDSGKTFQTILGVLSDLGYRVEWQVLNSKDFGVPQNRERIYFVGHLRGECGRKVFPITGTDEVHTRPDTAQEKVHAGTLTARQFTSWNGNYINQLNQPTHSNDRVYGTDGVSPTLNTMQGGNRQPFIAAQRGREVLRKVRTEFGKENRKAYESGELKTERKNIQQLEPRKDGITNTLTRVEKDNYLIDPPRIRRLTPKEYERLQGFPDDWTLLGGTSADQEMSDTQRYKMCGNAVTVNVVEAVMKGLLTHDTI